MVQRRVSHESQHAFASLTNPNYVRYYFLLWEFDCDVTNDGPKGWFL